MLNKLIDPPSIAEAKKLNKIAGNDTPCWTEYEPSKDPLMNPTIHEQAEAYTAGALSALLSAAHFIERHKDLDLRHVEADYDRIEALAMRIYLAASFRRRMEEINYEAEAAE